MSVEKLQLIDANFNIASSEAITRFLSRNVSKVVDPGANVNTVGTNYHVVGVFGRQSSGKSTLLNAVFGTSFQEMDETRGQGQTTQGVFLSLVGKKNKEENNTVDPLLICDVEGTDGKEDQNADRKLSLFALSIVDTLIININVRDIGCYNAANLSLLRTTFEENLKLYSRERDDRRYGGEKPTLLFVIRDLKSLNFFDANCKKLRGDIDDIWRDITKPEGLENCDIETIFSIRYFSFPHYEHQKDQFFEEVKKFRLMFGLSEEGVNKKEVPRNKIVPVLKSRNNYRRIVMDVLSEYLSNCWASIKKNQDLDIPTQRVLVSKLSCSKLVEKKVACFCSIFETTPSSDQSVEEYSKQLEYQRASLEAEFMLEAKMYGEEIATEYCANLNKELRSLISSLESYMISEKKRQELELYIRNQENKIEMIRTESENERIRRENEIERMRTESENERIKKENEIKMIRDVAIISILCPVTALANKLFS